MTSMHCRALVVVWLVACSACARQERAVITPPSPPAVEGPLLTQWTTDAGLDVQVQLFERKPWTGWAGMPRLPGKLVTSAEELPEGFEAPGVDFSRHLAIALNVTALGRAEVVSLPALVRGDEVHVVVSPPPQLCGGSSSTLLYQQEAALKRRKTLGLVPRPGRRLVIGLIDNSCNPAAP